MRLLLVGATGLVGGEVLKLALADDRISHITAPTRRPMPAHAKLENPLVDFEALDENAPWWRSDAVICALGSTIKKAGSQEAFRRVDSEYPRRVAELAFSHGTRAYALNSSIGANPDSSNFYLRTKGKVESALKGIGFDSLTLVRPSIIGGQRQEFRLGERIAIVLDRLLAPLIPKRYRVVPAERIAGALLDSAIKAEPGVRIIESEKI